MGTEEREEIEFGDVASDSEFVTRVTELNSALGQIERYLAGKPDALETLEDRIDNDLFTLYAINSLFWINLRLQGIDANHHPVKNHLQKVRQMMQTKKELLDKRFRPVLDKNVAARFIRSGLWDPNDPTRLNPPNKKTKFSD